MHLSSFLFGTFVHNLVNSLIYTSSEVALKSEVRAVDALISNLADIQVAHAQFVNLRG